MKNTAIATSYNGGSNADSRRSFAVRVKETMNTITEWAKDPVLDSGHIAPCGGGIENSLTSYEQGEISAPKALKKSAMKNATNTTPTEGPYVVDVGKSVNLVSKQKSQKQLQDESLGKNNGAYFLSSAIARCAPGLFLKNGNSTNDNNAASLFLCKGGACTSQDDMQMDKDSSMDQAYDKYMEAEQHQMHRLASWGTYATTDTYQSIVPANSTGTSMLAGGNNQGEAYDDDGNLIDSKIMEGTRKKMEKVKRMQKKHRKRVVKFEYPPITSLKQCPRTDPDDIPQLFFSEEELDMYEDDRRSTFTVDDVEIVAISTSLSEDNDPILKAENNASSPRRTSNGFEPTTPTSTVAGSFASDSFRNYVPTPKNNGGQSRKSGSSSNTRFSGNGSPSPSNHEGSSKRPSTPVSSRPATPTSRPATPVAPKLSTPSSLSGRPPTPLSYNDTSNSQFGGTTEFPFNEDNIQDNFDQSPPLVASTPKKKEKRLLKSVQIYLRERSTGL